MSTYTAPPVRLPYGPEPLQYVDFRHAHGGAAHGTVALIHGGYWRANIGSGGLQPFAEELAHRGWHTAEIEYRTVSAGGGWPTTFDDITAALNRVAAYMAEADTNIGPLIVCGHSAGGHLAAWVAVQSTAPVPPIAGVVSLAGVVNLTRGAREHLSRDAVVDFIGETPDRAPAVYAAADPTALIHAATPVPIRAFHGLNDKNVPYSQSVDFVDAAQSAGWDARLVECSVGHMEIIDLDSPSWPLIAAAIEELGTLASGSTHPGSSER